MSLLIPEGENLVTYYILPLLAINKNSFGGHFKNSYIDKAGIKVFVELKKNMVSPTYKHTPNYVSEVIFNNTLLVMFEVPLEFLQDSKLFVVGKYSEMSKDAKKIIFASSTLPYNKTMGSFVVSHPVLQALDKTKTLKSFLINELHVVTIEDSAELINPPYDNWFIEHRIQK